MQKDNTKYHTLILNNHELFEIYDALECYKRQQQAKYQNNSVLELYLSELINLQIDIEFLLTGQE